LAVGKEGREQKAVGRVGKEGREAGWQKAESKVGNWQLAKKAESRGADWQREGGRGQNAVWGKRRNVLPYSTPKLLNFSTLAGCSWVGRMQIAVGKEE
jgi:hypothetical protein